MTKETILLTLTSTGWTSAFLVNNKPNADMVDLFGTHELPTAFTERANPDDVLKEIQNRNPDCKVSFA